MSDTPPKIEVIDVSLSFWSRIRASLNTIIVITMIICMAGAVVLALFDGPRPLGQTLTVAAIALIVVGGLRGAFSAKTDEPRPYLD